MTDTLATLNWLVEAGADEAIADEPVNRLVAKAPVAPMPVAAPRPAAGAPAALRSSLCAAPAMRLAAPCGGCARPTALRNFKPRWKPLRAAA